MFEKSSFYMVEFWHSEKLWNYGKRDEPPLVNLKGQYFFKIILKIKQKQGHQDYVWYIQLFTGKSFDTPGKNWNYDKRDETPLLNLIWEIWWAGDKNGRCISGKMEVDMEGYQTSRVYEIWRWCRHLTQPSPKDLTPPKPSIILTLT